jgi:RNA polymerase sigma-70 factor (ECF subfamily)
MSESVTASAASLKAPGTEARLASPAADPRLVGLVEEHHSFVWRVLRRFGLGPTDADDGAQQVFIVLARRLADVEPSKTRAFLFRTAMHVASKAHRTRRRRPEEAHAVCPEEEDPGPTADELVERRRARELLDRILADMPEDLRAVIVLFEIEELTMHEIADALELPPGTVASRLRRARTELESRVLRARGMRRTGDTTP